MSKPTHILIPIQEVKDLIAQVDKKKKFEGEYEEGLAYGKKDILEDILVQGKQISLGEKDIEEKAEEVAHNIVPNTNGDDITLDYKRIGVDIGYKQALKDILL